MLFTIAALLGLGTLFFITYPLFFQPLRKYQLPVPDPEEFSQRDALLAALSELEEDQLMGRISRADYQQQKLTLQRQYLAVRAAEEDRERGKPPSVQEASGIGNET
jgi:hypothetical protein